jgi:hypothetical protein
MGYIIRQERKKARKGKGKKELIECMNLSGGIFFLLYIGFGGA